MFQGTVARMMSALGGGSQQAGEAKQDIPVCSIHGLWKGMCDAASEGDSNRRDMSSPLEPINTMTPMAFSNAYETAINHAKALKGQITPDMSASDNLQVKYQEYLRQLERVYKAVKPGLAGEPMSAESILDTTIAPIQVETRLNAIKDQHARSAEAEGYTSVMSLQQGGQQPGGEVPVVTSPPSLPPHKIG